MARRRHTLHKASKHFGLALKYGIDPEMITDICELFPEHTPEKVAQTIQICQGDMDDIVDVLLEHETDDLTEAETFSPAAGASSNDQQRPRLATMQSPGDVRKPPADPNPRRR
jgi:hypothetical protein